MSNKKLNVTKSVLENWLIIVMSILILIAIFIGYRVGALYLSQFDTLFPPSWNFILGADYDQRASLGAMGDYFGGLLNPVFGFIGLIMLLATLFQTQRELSLTRSEIKNSSKALSDQAATLKQQRFEGTFFSLLSLQNSVSNNLEIINGANIIKGKKVFEYLGKRFDSHYKSILHHKFMLAEVDGIYPTSRNFKDVDKAVRDETYSDLSLIDDTIDHVLRHHQSMMGQYFNGLVTIQDIIDTCDQGNKQQYVDILTSQMSPEELRLLLYVVICHEQYEKLMTYCSRYDLLVQISNSNEDYIDHHYELLIDLQGQ